jgi:hypothetical protein
MVKVSQIPTSTTSVHSLESAFVQLRRSDPCTTRTLRLSHLSSIFASFI